MRTLRVSTTRTSRPSFTSFRTKAGFCFLRRRRHMHKQHQMLQLQQIHGESTLMVTMRMIGGATTSVQFVQFESGGCQGGDMGGCTGGGGESATPVTICSHATVMPRLPKAANASLGQPVVPVPLPLGGSVTYITTDVFALVVGVHSCCSDADVKFELRVLFSVHAISSTAYAQQRTRRHPKSVQRRGSAYKR